jgi:hypothetical protein
MLNGGEHGGQLQGHVMGLYTGMIQIELGTAQLLIDSAGLVSQAACATL